MIPGLTTRGHASARRILVCLACVTAFGVRPCAAQTASEPVGRLQVAVGVGWLGGTSFGEQAADLRTATSSPYRLFNSETDLRPAGSFEARVGVALTRRYGIEGRASISSPQLRTVVTSDAETTGSFTIAETVDRYVFDGGIMIRLTQWDGMGLSPFASAGAGYVRQLHGDQSLVEDGYLYYVGGGITRPLFSRPQGLIRGASVRADLRLDIVSLDLDDDSHAQGSIAGSLVLIF